MLNPKISTILQFDSNFMVYSSNIYNFSTHFCLTIWHLCKAQWGTNMKFSKIMTFSVRSLIHCIIFSTKFCFQCNLFQFDTPKIEKVTVILILMKNIFAYNLKRCLHKNWYFCKLMVIIKWLCSTKR